MTSTSKQASEELSDSHVADRISDAVEQTKSKINEFSSAAAEKIEDNRVAAATGLDKAADKLSATAEYVRENNLSSMMSDVEKLVKKNPKPSLLVAASLGFLIARAFSHDSRG